jgi:hypothetical protein
MLNVTMLNVTMLNVAIQNIIMLSVIMQTVVTLNVIMLSVVMLNVVTLNVAMLNVLAPFVQHNVDTAMTLLNRVLDHMYVFSVCVSVGNMFFDQKVWCLQKY